jgi:ABC-type sugar transport system ATPase subunit
MYKHGKAGRRCAPFRKAIDAGLAYVTEDRKTLWPRT